MQKYFYFLLALAAITFGSYQLGKSNTEKFYEAILTEQKQKVSDLEKREAVVEKVVVTEYKDRIKYLDRTKKETVEVIKEVIKNEATNCVIGSGFIRLFNSQATGEAISSGSSGISNQAQQPTTTE